MTTPPNRSASSAPFQPERQLWTLLTAIQTIPAVLWRVSVPLSQGGLATSEISTGIPTGLPGSPTAVDGSTGVTLAASGKLNITFQPDGSVIDATNTPVDTALFIYNNQASQGTASAISVRGASGRVKIWRYTVNANNANSSTYIE